MNSNGFKKWGGASILFGILLFSDLGMLTRNSRAQDSQSPEAEHGQENGETQPGARRRFRGRAMMGQASVRFNLKEVRISYGKAPITGPDYKEFPNTKDGAVVRFTQAPALKLRTAVNLKFGDAVIKEGNVAKDYPGIYTLWLKKVKDGWHLVFNKDGDIWGTQHDPTLDIAEIPLVAKKIEEPVQTLTVELKGEEKKGELRIAWGTDEWTTKFEVVD